MNHIPILGPGADAEEDDEEESRAFLTALLNGQAASAEKIIKMTAIRFDSQARRLRELRQEQREMTAMLNEALIPIRFLRRTPVIVTGIAGLIGAVAGAVTALLKLGGWL